VPNTDARSLFAKKLRHVRRKRGFSQEELAELAQCSRNYVSIVENGHKAASLDAIVRFARALKVKPAELMADIP
jgi:transcriptional regulator with XRE-family HTH domain